MVRRWAFRLLLLFGLLAARENVARAEELPPLRQATFEWDDKQILRMSIKYGDIVDGPTSSKLASGLPTTILMRAYVFREAGGEAIAATYKKCRVTFDLWEEVYRIDIEQTGILEPVSDAAITLEGVLRRCAEADKLQVARRSLLAGQGRYYIAATVEVNPVSPDMLERIKRWVSRPVGTNVAAPGDALFGSFVGLFAARIGIADRFIPFRTQFIQL